jgi:exosortase/archaeosortase family protein
MALTLIRSLGLDAVRDGTVISHSAGFAYEISRGCTGVIPALLLAVGVLAWPGAGSRKLLAALLGILLLLGLNLIRLVHLFYLGVRRPELFGIAHEVIWQAVLVLTVFALWLGFTRWTGSAMGAEPFAHRAARALRIQAWVPPKSVTGGT